MPCLLFVIYVLIYVGVRSFKPKKTKKRVSSVTLPCAVAMAHGKVTVWAGLEQDFAVCQNSAHGKVTILRRVPQVWHTAKPRAWPCVCCPSTRRSLELCRVPAVRTHGEAWIFTVCPRRRHTANSRRRRQLAVTASACFFFAMCLYIHTAYSFAVCPTIGARQIRSLPSS